MPPPLLSRRQFAVLTAGIAATTRIGLSSASAQVKATLTAQQVVDRLHEKAASGWPKNASAGIKAGSADTAVRGVATTSMATLDVLKQAAKSGLNLVLTYEPTFFSRSDGGPEPAGRSGQAGPPGGRGVPANDPILLAKKKFIEENGLVVYRVGDHWQTGEDLSLALGTTLGWSKSRTAEDPLRYTIPASPLSEVLVEMKQKLGIRGGMRVMGDPHTRIQRVAILPGIRTLADLLKYLPESDLVIAGETRDWEGIEYGADTNAAGFKKGLATIGRVVSEDPGMVSLSTWIKTFVTEVPVQAIAAMDPYWRPA